MNTYTTEEMTAVIDKAWGVNIPEFVSAPPSERRRVLIERRDFVDQLNAWLAEGKGIAVYENHDLGHPQLGHQRFFTYGTDDATFDLKHCPRCSGELFENLYCGNSACSGHDGVTEEEASLPPKRLPDFPREINWRYTLIGVYRGEPLS